MNQCRSTIVAILLTATAAMPCGAQQAPATPQAMAGDACAGCFAYLEFSPSLEPESYAMRGQATEGAPVPAAEAPDGRREEEQTPGMVAASEP